MRKTASQILRSLERRIARLEKQSNIEWKVEGFPLDGDDYVTHKFRGDERQFIKWFKGENLENRLDDIQIYGDGDDWEVYNGKLSRTARLEKQSKTVRAEVSLGRRGRDYVNTQILEWLGSYGDHNKQYVAVDVSDEVEFFDDSAYYVEVQCELEYIDVDSGRERTEEKGFYISLDSRLVKHTQGIYDDNSIWKAIMAIDSSDIEEL